MAGEILEPVAGRRQPARVGLLFEFRERAQALDLVERDFDGRPAPLEGKRRPPLADLADGVEAEGGEQLVPPAERGHGILSRVAQGQFDLAARLRGGVDPRPLPGDHDPVGVAAEA
jgi:hypothetical protein